MDALDLMQVVAKMVWLGQVVENVFHLVGDQPLADDDAVIDIQTYMDDLYQPVAAEMSDNLLFDSIVIHNLTENVLLGEFNWPVLVAGSIAGTTALPTQVSGLVTLPTAIPKRRGRKFVPGFTEADLNSGLWTTAVTDVLEDFGNYLSIGQSEPSGAGWFYRVFSGTLGPGSASAPTGFVVTNVPSTLSRRRIGAGE